MARAGIILRVLVSSPADVEAECATVLTAIHDWNSSHSADLGIILEPVQWRTHAYPESGDRPQAIINKQIVDDSDMVVAVFGHRIGTATGSAPSGTIEEIERLRAQGKQVAVYFSTAPVPYEHDHDQFRLLKEYRESLKENTLYWTFSSTQDLYRQVAQHLARSVSRLYQQLSTSGAIRVLASQLPGSMSTQAVAHEGEPAKEASRPFYLQHVFIGEFPDPIKLRLTANRKFEAQRIEYLDENGVRVSAVELQASSRPTEDNGGELEIQIDHHKLIQVHNLKPRGSEAFPIQFKLLLTTDGNRLSRVIPALLQPAYKQLNNSQTYFMKIIG